MPADSNSAPLSRYRQRRRRSPVATRLLALLIATLTGLVGCFTGGIRCEDDSDCGGSQCTRTGECSIEVVYVALTWTINGGAADEAACSSASKFEVMFEDTNTASGSVTYAPVRCTLGQIYFDRMPNRLDRVTLRADDNNGRAIAEESVTITAPGIEAAIDIRLPATR